jgi:hypothetical protein
LKTYVGVRGENGVTVTVDAQPLDLRLDWRNHSPTGFDWGYGGSGPSQLALAILADHFGVEGKEVALRLYQNFKWDVIGNIEYPHFKITSAEIDIWLDGKSKEVN